MSRPPWKRMRVLGVTGMLPGVVACGLLAGCGKPPPPAGPPADFPVPSVVARVEIREIEERLPLVGTLRAIDSADLLAEAEGRVMETKYREGQAVKGGAILLRLDDRKAKAAVKEAEARLARAASDRKRGEELLASETIAAQEADRLREAEKVAEAGLEAARAALDDTLVRAPFDGVAGEKRVSEGQFVTRGSVLGSITVLDPLDLVFDVPERHAGRVRAGQVVGFKTVAAGDPKTAEVVYLSPTVDVGSRTLQVKGRVGNADGTLRPGMFGTVDLVVASREKAVAVPEAAINVRGEGVSVVRVGEDRSAGIVPVKLGMRGNGWVEVTEGLEAGQIVVVEGHQKLAPGAKVVFAPESSRYGVEPDPPPGSGGPKNGAAETGNKEAIP